MFSIDFRVRSIAAGTLLAMFVGAPVVADDLEIYHSQPNVGARPNVLFILDTSGSMDTDVQVTPAPYDPNVEYEGSCSADRIYYTTGNTAPSCGTRNYIYRSNFHCIAAAEALKNIGGSGMWPGLGNPGAQAAQYRRNDGYWAWRSLDNDEHSADVECRADDGIHGQNGTTTKKHIANGGNGPWSSTQYNLWAGGAGDDYRFYTGNYLNYLAGPGSTTMTRLQIVRDVAINLASSLQNVNLGLMRYSSDAQGGYILAPVANIATNRTSIINTLKSFDPNDGNNGTPLSETFYEAALYLQGKTWDYGSRSSPNHSVWTSRVLDANGYPTSTYKSPIEYSCQKNYIVYLTDGAPTVDTDANSKIETMIGKSCQNQVEPTHDNGWVEGSGICMDELAAWMANEETDLAPSIPGKQNALTYMIGFGDSVKASVPYLNAIAEAGGTKAAYTAGDVPTLTTALQTIFSDLQEDSGTFVTPSIAVNAFNRAQADNDLFFSLFKVGKTRHWPGNLKKYMLLKGEIVDKNEKPAVDATGFFADTAQSIWSDTPDGDDITAGGAAGRLPAPDSRKLYTSVAGKDLTADANAVTVANMTDALVGAGSDTSACGTECQKAVNWARGKDVNDLDNDEDFDEQVRFMGDPIHGHPAVVTYGKTPSGTDSDTVVFLPTNDGFLHAITGVSDGADAGEELWAYIPPELLPRLASLSSTEKNSHTYGLDGDIRVLRFDKNQNGVIDPDTDYVYLFFGMRAGGSNYYALDVTDRKKPKLLWSIGPAELPDIGQSWSPPVVTRVNVSGKNTDPEKFVLIFGGGYDPTQETQTYSTDTVGNRIYMVEAKTGKLLWSAGSTSSTGTPAPDLKLAEMTNSIPARIAVIDTNGDQFADRMYAGDMGGRLWRFDIFNNNTPDKLVTGGVIAKLGAGGISPTPAASQNRRFYNAPDVSLYQNRSVGPFYNIAIGSGYRGHPLDNTTEERFYVIRDKQPYAQYTQEQYNSITPLLDTSTSLVDITSDPAGTAVGADAAGWKLTLTRNGAGEKVLAESTTVDNVVLFTTFQPATTIVNPCFPATINRAYALTTFAGKPAINFNDSGTSKDKLDNGDLFTDLNQGGIVGEVNVAMLHEDDKTNPVCITGLSTIKCIEAGATVRTFWSRSDAK
ncbi:MAG: hypothetical protein IRZ28_09675 [Steroidobacteraceae bacterium]|nr:hypothetical protein [Steroidobacteraceae bacterium]